MTEREHIVQEMADGIVDVLAFGFLKSPPLGKS
jgi:hypothetical protein